MASHGPSSPPFIKPEPDDFFDSHRDESNPQNGNLYAPWHGSSVNALDIGMSNNNNMSHQYNTAQSMPSNFATGNSAFTDDDLLASFTLSSPSNQHTQHNHPNQRHQSQAMESYPNGYQQQMNIRTAHPSQLSGYSNTPDGAPIQSPFTQGNFDFGQWQTVPQPGQMSNQMARPGSGNGMQLNGGAFPGQHMQNHHGPRGHQHSLSSQWDSSPGSGFLHNYDSPMASPNGGPVHPQIAEVLKSGTPTSPRLSASRTGGKPATSAEAKKAKRRASHNEVERRRRNHINDRITELSELVPKHRLEDEAVKRSVTSSAGMPLGLSGSSISPPATSGLAGSLGRRAASIPHAPVDDRDKGPAKGEVLDGAVGWTRDLLWMMNKMLAREQDMRQTISQLGGPLPQPYGDDEKRMISEARGAIQHNLIAKLHYSRRHGTDLFVPGHTNHAGEPMAPPSQPSMSPSSVFDLDTNNPTNGNTNGGSQFWGYPFKEEDEAQDESFQMEMS